MDFNLEDTIETLKSLYGERVIGQKHGTEVVSIPKVGRKEILRHLVNTGKEKGQDKEYFKKGSVQTVIIEACFPEARTRNWDKKIKEGAYAVVKRELKEVLADIWPEDTYLAQAPEQAALATNATEWNPAKQGRIGKELDRSVLEGMPEPSRAFDAEAAKLLGFDDE